MDASTGAGKSQGECRGKEPEEQATDPAFQTLKSLEDPPRRSQPIEPSHGLEDILVWWDIETCPLPSTIATSLTGEGAKAPCLLQELQRHLQCDQIRVTINVYGNGGPSSKAGLDALIASGITLQHRILPCKVPGAETAALKTMIVDIALWALSNPAPANVFLVSAARDTSLLDLVNGLHFRDYNIHLATTFSWSEAEERDDAHSLFNPMPRHWSVSKQLFVVRSAPSHLESVDAGSLQGLLPNKLTNLHVQ